MRQTALDKLRFKLAELQNQEEHPPPDLSQLEEEIKQQEARLAKEQESVSLGGLIFGLKTDSPLGLYSGS